MPHWMIKSLLQRAISCLPQPQRWNYLFQKYCSKSLDLSAPQFESRLEHCRRHLDHLQQFGARGIEECSVLELGAGWFPTIALGMHLCGVRKIWTMDIDPLLRPALLRRLLQYFDDYGRRDQLQQWLPEVKAERLAGMRELLRFVDYEKPADVLARLHITVKVGDAQCTGLAEGSVDLFFSTGVFEYIPPPVLAGILREFRRVAAPAAVMSHWISIIDKFSYFDSRITPFNYMNYSARRWKWRDSPLIPQSRLRVSAYRRLIGEAGFNIVHEDNANGVPADLARVNLAPEFCHYSQEDLLVLFSWIVARTKA